MTGQPLLRLVVADDHPIVREGLVLILNNQSDMSVVGDCGDGREAVNLVLALMPDVAILDLQMPSISGVAATVAILDKWPEAHLLLLSNYEGSEDIRRAMQAGAMGYLLKESGREEILQAIRSVSKGKRYLSPSAGASFANISSLPLLTKRERQILRLVSEGKANKEIGFSLDISEGTVKSHMNVIMQKMNVGSRTEAAMVAQQSGLLRR